MDRRSFILILLFSISMFFVNNWLFDKPKPKTNQVQITEVAPIQAAEIPSKKAETFYVLENEYQQIVFSNIGGAIKEINLPFKSSSNTSSIVLPIEFDTQIEKQSPKNSQFPLQSYMIAGESSAQLPKEGGYYPLLRRGILSQKASKTIDVSPSYYGLNILSDETQSFTTGTYKVTNFTKESITFEISQNHRTITKTYRLAKNQGSFIPYSLTLDVEVDGSTSGLSITSGVPEVEIVSSSPAPSIKYLQNKKNGYSIEKFKLPKNSSSITDSSIGWVSNSNGYFGLIVNPVMPTPSSFEGSFIPGQQDPTRLTLVQAAHNLYPAKNYPGYQVEIPFKPTEKKFSFNLYAGPYDQSMLKKADAGFSALNGSSPEFTEALTSQGFFAFISVPFAKFLFIVMKFFYNFTHSWVIAIFFLTVVLKIILLPLNNWSMQSQSKLEKLSPQLKSIKTRYGNDPKRQQLEMMQFYKDQKVNPIAPFLIMFLQFPFILGMLDLLKSVFPLRGATFIPGWIDNLTSPDVLFSWSYPIPLIGNQFHLLPLILGGITFLQMKLASSKNKILDEEARKQANTANYMLPIFMTVIFYNFPSGLNIYWIFSTILGIVQQYIMTKKPSLLGVKR